MSPSRKILWHYTDTAGFHGIVRNNRLRLGDARFLNDRTEREYGIKLVISTIAEHLKEGQDHFLAMTGHFLQRNEHRVHVCSFSEVPDSISQWQRYGADGYGYCLGFSAALLRKLETTELTLCRVEYKPNRQREMVQQRLHLLREGYRLAAARRESDMPEHILIGTSAALAAVVLDSIALQLKDPSFADEREWRLIHRALRPIKSDDGAQPLDFAPRGYFVKPFIEVELTLRRRARSPLTSVACGPRVDGDLAVSTATYFLRATGHAIDAEWSPLHRTWR